MKIYGPREETTISCEKEITSINIILVQVAHQLATAVVFGLSALGCIMKGYPSHNVVLDCVHITKQFHEKFKP